TKLKIYTYYDSSIAYDISVSPFIPLADNLSNNIKISRKHNNSELLKNTNKKEYEIEVIRNDTDVQDTELYPGSVMINVNYN
ncbi:MAG: hypothetical protein KAU21_19210, partial [Gammaproteobacteria bacterium]|nr:hypothetical protein [Gammaproteobacteria bacterium]